MNIDDETKKLNILSNNYEKEKSSYFSSLERDADRKDGSARQDALHDQLMKESKDRYLQARNAFEAQVKLVAELLKD